MSCPNDVVLLLLLTLSMGEVMLAFLLPDIDGFFEAATERVETNSLSGSLLLADANFGFRCLIPANSPSHIPFLFL